MIFLVDNCRGIYMGQSLAKNYYVEGVEQEDLDILEVGPEHEYYDEALDEVLSKGKIFYNGEYMMIMVHPHTGDFMGVTSEQLEKEDSDLWG